MCNVCHQLPPQEVGQTGWSSGKMIGLLMGGLNVQIPDCCLLSRHQIPSFSSVLQCERANSFSEKGSNAEGKCCCYCCLYVVTYSNGPIMKDLVCRHSCDKLQPTIQPVDWRKGTIFFYFFIAVFIYSQSSSVLCPQVGSSK